MNYISTIWTMIKICRTQTISKKNIVVQTPILKDKAKTFLVFRPLKRTPLNNEFTKDS